VGAIRLDHSWLTLPNSIPDFCAGSFFAFLISLPLAFTGLGLLLDGPALAAGRIWYAALPLSVAFMGFIGGGILILLTPLWVTGTSILLALIYRRLALAPMRRPSRLQSARGNFRNGDGK
jgi:hypothetical protein